MLSPVSTGMGDRHRAIPYATWVPVVHGEAWRQPGYFTLLHSFLPGIQEYSLEKAKKKMVHDWETVTFTMTLYRDTGVSILASVDDILMLLEDHIVRTQTMRGSPFIKPFEKEIREWEERMIRIQETIDEWLKVHRYFCYFIILWLFN